MKNREDFIKKYPELEKDVTNYFETLAGDPVYEYIIVTQIDHLYSAMEELINSSDTLEDHFCAFYGTILPNLINEIKKEDLYPSYKEYDLHMKMMISIWDVAIKRYEESL